MSTDEDNIKFTGAGIEFKNIKVLKEFAEGVDAAIWEPNRKKMRPFLEMHREKIFELKECWHEIRNRDWGEWGLLMATHVRMFASEAEKILGKEQCESWLVPGNYFSGMDLMQMCTDILQESEWDQGSKWRKAE